MKTNQIIQGDALTELKKLPEKSINMCMTSPPYFNQRDYGTDVETIWEGDSEFQDCEHDFNLIKRKDPQDRCGSGDHDPGGKAGVWEKRENETGFCKLCGAWKGQLGLEPTFDLYIKHLCDIFDEVKRVLRDDGTCWINLGDTYSGAGRGGGTDESKQTKGAQGKENLGNLFKINYQDKCLTLIPFRFAIEMVNRGWILRNVIIWYKPNCMPSSVKDRFTVDFEYIFFFSKKKKYYFETQYEPIKTATIERNKYGWDGAKVGSHSAKRKPGSFATKMPPIGGKKHPGSKENPNPTYSGNQPEWNQLGRNKRTVWQICPQPFGENICMVCGTYDKPKSKQEKKGYFGGKDKSERVCKGCGNELITSHFAIYPEELCETPISAGCPEFVCVKCGNPKVLDLDYSDKYSAQWGERQSNPQEFIKKLLKMLM